jgi:hypothetical protein
LISGSYTGDTEQQWILFSPPSQPVTVARKRHGISFTGQQGAPAQLSMDVHFKGSVDEQHHSHYGRIFRLVTNCCWH